VREKGKGILSPETPSGRRERFHSKIALEVIVNKKDAGGKQNHKGNDLGGALWILDTR